MSDCSHSPAFPFHFFPISSIETTACRVMALNVQLGKEEKEGNFIQKKGDFHQFYSLRFSVQNEKSPFCLHQIPSTLATAAAAAATISSPARFLSIFWNGEKGFQPTKKEGKGGEEEEAILIKFKHGLFRPLYSHVFRLSPLSIPAELRWIPNRLITSETKTAASKAIAAIACPRI